MSNNWYIHIYIYIRVQVKKLKDKYIKLKLFKVYEYDCKSDERCRRILIN
jgi:hypothetical protein